MDRAPSLLPAPIVQGTSYFDHWRNIAVLGHPEMDRETVDKLAIEILSKSEEFRRRYLQLIQHGKVFTTNW